MVSFTEGAQDIANVYALAELACAPNAPPELDVVPLFETIADLRNARATLDAMLDLEPVRRRMAATGRAIEVMLGYSDSAKESGPVTATLVLYAAQADLTAWAADRSVQLTLFHGRGGALGRGGGPANRAVMAQAPGSVSGRFKVTEQGEVIFARYGNQTIAQRHIEQVTSAVLLTSTPAARERTEHAAIRFDSLAHSLDTTARAAYRELTDIEGFAEYFAEVTPVRELARLHLGSRPASRGGDQQPSIAARHPLGVCLVADPAQSPRLVRHRQRARVAAPLDELRVAYVEWPLLNVLIDNAEMSLAKTDRFMAADYLRLGNRPAIDEVILAEYDRTHRGHPRRDRAIPSARAVAACCPGRSSCATRTSTRSVICSFVRFERCAPAMPTISIGDGSSSSSCSPSTASLQGCRTRASVSGAYDPSSRCNHRTMRGDSAGDAVMKIGVVGIGKMGRPIAERLIAAGHDVAICNRSDNAGVQTLREQGATVLGTPAELAARAEVVLTALPTEDTVRQVYTEMSAVASSGQMYADHSTVSPGLNRHCAEILAKRGRGLPRCAGIGRSGRRRGRNADGDGRGR